MANEFLKTGDLAIPDQVFDPWLGKVQYGSSVAALSNSIPMKFGKGSTMTFDIGEAEYVGEGANKGPTEYSATAKTVNPYKFHKTVRWTEEVMWADQDHQLGVVQQVLNLIQPALSRALDFGVYHGINPNDGTIAGSMIEKLSDTSNEVTIVAQSPYELLDAADQLVLASSFLPSSVALDPSFASSFYSLRTEHGVKIYPDLQLTTEVSNLEGHRSSVSRTVGAETVAAAATNVSAFVGDFSAIQWGIQRQIGLEIIEFGDPDGQGDLKRNNQVAFRAEVVYGWGIADLAAFAKIVTT